MKKIGLSQRFLFLMSAVFGVLIIGWQVYYARYGLDFTDEGFYLNWISNPFNYSYSTSGFGFVYYPVYKYVLAENLVALRVFSILSVFLLATLLSFLSIQLFANKVYDRKSILLISIALGSTASITISGSAMFLSTPNYNTLNFFGMLIVFVGVILSLNENAISGAKMLFIANIISIGGIFVFMAKPPTAALMAVVTLLIVLIFSKNKMMLIFTILISTALYLLGVTYLVDGSLSDFVGRYKLGLEAGSILNSKSSLAGLFRWDDLILPDRTKIWITLFTSYTFFGLLVFTNKNRYLKLLSTSLIGLSFAFGIFIILSQDIYVFNLGRSQLLLPLSLLIVSFVTLIFFLFQNKEFNGEWLIYNNPLLVLFTVFLIIMPHIYAFGTNNNYWQQAAGGAAYFWILSGFLVLLLIKEGDKKIQIVAFLLTAQLITVLNLDNAINKPYRQPQALFFNDEKLQIRNFSLILEKGFASYFSNIASLGDEHEITKGSYFIDFSGQSPTVAFVFGASPLGVAWNLGGHLLGSDFLRFAMKQSGCSKISKAWLLDEPAGPRAISTDLLLDFNLSLERDFFPVRKIKTPVGAGGYKFSREQIFYKPNTTSILKYCKFDQD